MVMKTRQRKANRLDPDFLTQLLPLCLHFMTKNEEILRYACPIIKNFSEDRFVGIIYLPTKFQFHMFIIQRRSIIGQETLVDLCLNFIKIKWEMKSLMTSFKFSQNNGPYVKFYSTCKHLSWNQYTTI